MLTHALADPRNRPLAGAGLAAAATLLAVPTGLVATGHAVVLVALVAGAVLAASALRWGGRLHAAAARRARVRRTDDLTGILNRRAFAERAARFPDGATLLRFDLDAVTTLDDAYGAAAGDRVLRAVASRLRASVRQSDVVARLGGDQFAVLLAPGADAAAVAERALRRLREPVPFDGAQLWPDASVDVVVASRDERLEQLLGAPVLTPS